MNFKPWQIFVFSLIPLALAFIGVIGGSIHGADSDLEDFSQTAAPPPGSGGPQPTAVPGSTRLTIAAANLVFDKRSLTAQNGPVSVTLDNKDAGVLHNIGFYRSRTALNQPLAPGAKSELFAGPGTQTLNFTTPGAGTYFFQCDAHPDTMNGSFIVQ